jgi:hypothetical protein
VRSESKARIHTVNNHMYYKVLLAILGFLPLVSWAETLNDCARLRGDAEWECRARATLSATYCAKITSWERRVQCQLEIVRRTRNSQK